MSLEAVRVQVRLCCPTVDSLPRNDVGVSKIQSSEELLKWRQADPGNSVEHSKTSCDIRLQGMRYHFAGFNRVYSPKTSQDDIFHGAGSDTVANLVDGYNAAILTYGQSKSGKTYTIFGGSDSPKDAGLLTRSVDHLFTLMRAKTTCSYTVTISVVNAHGDEIQDLLDHRSSLQALDIGINSDQSQVRSASQKPICSARDVDALLKEIRGQDSPRSWRSRHTLFTLHLAQQYEDGQQQYSRLDLVDLAASDNEISDPDLKCLHLCVKVRCYSGSFV
eukprot:SAG31_NODE_4685_length_3032_cov_15.682237_3_plen_276_part_00